MKFSLILATLHRTGEVDYFLKTLDAQTYRDFELIVVDQNADDRLLPLLNPYQSRFPILHLRSEKGLSLARNAGLNHISGDLVAFPDDDCAYPPNLLEDVALFFEKNPDVSGLTGRSISKEGKNTGGRWAKQRESINFLNVWRLGISYTIFLRRSVAEKVGCFDEQLGVGANTPWGSAEETDYLIRALEQNLYYDPLISVIHPIIIDQENSNKKKADGNSPKPFLKTYSYALGRGYVLRKHNAPLWFVLYNWVRPIAGIALCTLKIDFYNIRSYWATLKGRVLGWLQQS